jgi:tRNA threonylcarbamoyladenosine biosynthesis protein TsaB
LIFNSSYGISCLLSRKLLVKLISMKILAIETATKAGSIAIMDGSTFIGEVRLDVSIAHAERVMNSIAWLLKSSNISIGEIDAFAVSIGPGSFTGLRIGLSTIKGLAFSTGKPIVPVPTLDAIARRFPFCSYSICPMLDARKNEVYAALYKWEGNLCRKVVPETAIAPERLLEKLEGPTVFIGDGAVTYKDVIVEKMRSDAIYPASSLMSPAASAVAEIALEMLKQGIDVDPQALTPFYIRRSEAEINWKG